MARAPAARCWTWSEDGRSWLAPGRLVVSPSGNALSLPRRGAAQTTARSDAAFSHIVNMCLFTRSQLFGEMWITFIRRGKEKTPHRVANDAVSWPTKE